MRSATKVIGVRTTHSWLLGLTVDLSVFCKHQSVDLVLGCDLSKKLCCRRCSGFWFQFRVWFLVPRCSGFWVHDVPRSGFDEVWFSIAGLLKKMMGSGCCSSGVANDEVGSTDRTRSIASRRK
ncbi:hypothetical protein U1Q18_009826 [Sarracenia purpurea var. burkii]